MAYPDLQTMFNNGLGSFASMQVGQQQAEAQQAAEAEQQKQKALLQEQLLKNQQAQVMNPLDAMFRQGQVNQQNAQLPGFQAESEMAQSKNRVQQGTEASQIAAAISENQNKIGEDGMKKIQRGAAIARQGAALLRTVPVMQRPAALASFMDQYGQDSSTTFMKSFVNMPPDKMPDMIDQVGQGMAMASDNYITEMAKQKSVNDTHIKTAQIGAGATLGAAKINADSRMQVAQMAAQARRQMAENKPKSTDQAIAALSAIPESERSQDEWNQLALLSKQRIAERSAGVNSLAAGMTGQPNPMATAQAQSPVQPPVGSSSNVPPPDAQIQHALATQGMAYEPDKYMYRIGPNGQVQRKAK